MKVVPMTMLTSRRAAWGLIATAVFVIVAFGVPLAASGGHGLATHAPVGAATPEHAAPSVLAHANPNVGYFVNVTITNNYTGPVTPPVVINYPRVVSGVPLDPANVSVGYSVTAGTPAQVINTGSMPVVAGQASYSVPLDYYAIGGYITLPTDNYSFQLTATISDPNIAPAGSMSNVSNDLNISTLIVVNPDVVFSQVLPVYDTLPIQVNFSATVAAANSGIVANAANVSVGLSFSIVDGNIIGYDAYNNPIWSPIIVGNVSLPFSASGDYSITINASFLATTNTLDGQLPSGSYAITPYMTVVNSAVSGFPQRSVQAQTVIQFSPNVPTLSVVGPVNTTTGLVAGKNVTIAVFYSGDYVTSAVIKVFNQASGGLSYTQGVFSPGNGAHAATATWVPGSAGLYTIDLIITASYLTGSMTASITNVQVVAAPPAGSQITYVNTTTWHNTSLFGGLSQGTASALLLVVGLVIGMIVALALGRMMWGSSKPASPQPWSAKPTNECTVCHQSFATPQELAEHSKQAHGMG